MTDEAPNAAAQPVDETQALKREIARLNKMVQALMDRVERSVNSEGSDFGLLQSTVMLEDLVRQRTAELEAALRAKDAMTHELQRSEGRLRAMANQTIVGIGVAENGRVTYINPRLEEMYGYSLEELQGMDLMSIVIEEDRALSSELMRKRWSGELDEAHYVFRARRKDGRIIDVEVHGSTARLDSGMALVSVALDITERVRAERELQAVQLQLREQSIRDSLTGLYNRRHFEEALARELIIHQRTKREVSLVIADVDRFKSINDEFGHPAGDEVLREVAQVIRSHSRTSDIFCRYGGEEFILVMPGMPQAAAVERAELLRAEISCKTVHYGRAEIAVTASFGVASFPQDGLHSGDLITAADKAMYAAKRGGRNQVRSATKSG